MTLLELMIVIAIVGILATVAIPQYGAYATRAKFADVVAQTRLVKLGVELCLQEEGPPDNCNGGGLATDHHAIPADIPPPGKNYLLSLSVSRGVITAQGNSEVGDATYVLSPLPRSGAVHWEIDESSTCLELSYCR